MRFASSRLMRSMGARIFAYCFIGVFAIGSLLLLAIAVGSTAQRAMLVIAGSSAFMCFKIQVRQFCLETPSSTPL
jgi:hypothetical protein